MKLNKIIIKDKPTYGKVKIVLFGDQHIGSKDCDIKKLKQDINKIKLMKNAYVILMGDTINSALRDSVGAGSFDDIMNPEEQIETAVELLKPIKSKIIGIHTGNHGERIYKSTTLNPEKIISRELGVKFLDKSALHYIRCGQARYVLFTTHGSTNAITLTGALNACMKYRNFINADVYCMGHSHKLAAQSEIYYELNKRTGCIETKYRYFVLTGSYLKWNGSYAETKSYPPQKLGFVVVNLGFNQKEINIET